MQMTMDQAFRPGLLAFALKHSKGYVMRSEKRPGYGGGASGGGSRKPGRPKAGLFYIIMTIIISVILWPVGMVMLWRKKVRMQAGTKLLISLLTMCLCIFLIVFALTVHVDNEKYTEFQDQANDWLNKASADLAVAGDAAYRQGVETWGVMTEFAENASEPVMNTVADGMDRAVALACQARSKIQGVPVEEIVPEALSDLVPKTEIPVSSDLGADGSTIEIHLPGNTPAPEDARPLEAGLLSPDGSVKPGETPEPTQTPEPTAAPTATPEPTEAPLVWSTVDAQAAAEIEAVEEQPLAAAEVEPVGDAKATDAPEDTAEPSAKPDDDAAAKTAEEPAAATAEVEPVTVEAESEGADAAAADEPTAEPTKAPAMTVKVKPAGEARVYYNATGKLYHMQSTCKRMSGAAPHTLAEAVVDGKLHCDDCGTPRESIIREAYTAWVDTNNVYHTSDACPKFVGEWTLISLNDAINGDYTACPDCEADIYTALHADDAARIAAEATAEPTPEPTATPTAEPTAEPEPTPTPEPRVVTPSVTLKPVGEATVYHSSNGKFYHRHEICKGMTGSDPYTLAEVAGGYRRCNTCSAPDAEMVGKPCLWIDGNNLCHTSDECAAFSGDYNFILREDALAEGLKGCPDCGADQYLEPGTVLALND